MSASLVYQKTLHMQRRLDMNNQSENLTYTEAAHFLGIPVGTVYSMVARRQLPHLRLGKRLVRFSRHDLEAWVAARRVEAVTPSHR
jgi:excisionase family DNA binding protein